MDNYIYTKTYIENIIGHSIREDTYIILNRMANGEKYDEIIIDLRENLTKYNLEKLSNLLNFTSKTTIDKYLDLITKEANEPEEEIQLETNVEQEILSKSGIYGIFYKTKLLYIGHTDTSFRTAFNAHRAKSKRGEQTVLNKILAKYITDEREFLNFKPLIIYDNIKLGNKSLSQRDKGMMVLGLITLYQPVGNIRGRVSNYWD